MLKKEHSQTVNVDPQLPVTEQPVGVMPRISFERACLLAKMGITTIGDLFFYIPLRYEDKRNVRKISTLEKGEQALVFGKVIECGVQKFRRSRKFLTKAIIEDESGKLHCHWWNQRWPAESLKPEREVIIFGKVDSLHPPQMSNPEFEVKVGYDNSRLGIGRIVPIYSLTEGVPQWWIRDLISRALDRFLKDLPHGYVYESELGFPSRPRAVQMLHHPAVPGEEELARKRLAMDELLDMQMEIQRRRKNLLALAHGIKCPGNNLLIRPFLKNLDFTLTPSQTEVLREIRADLNSGVPMRRLLQGDVGSGKTVVAASVALMVMEAGYQVVLMAPTEILASQHVKTFRKWFEPLGVRVRQWTGRLRDEADSMELLEKGSAAGKTEIVIGTHALIEDTFQIEKLGLVIIDEQHKFGVDQRERLLKKGSWPHLLAMTATPIPRTLGLTLYGELDISSIKHPPEGRGTIRTFIRKRDKLPAVWEFVKKRLIEGRQTYVVYPMIDETSNPELKAVEAEFSRIAKRIAPFKAGLLHGRMKGSEKEYVMQQFAHNLVQLLVTTSVVEVGVDVPNATVMIVENAERFGLAQLHQFRGRIGRGKENSFCILIVGNSAEDSMKRLKILAESRDGFRIAEEDLKIRGPGDFLGDRQHGMPSFRFAKLLEDYALVQRARKIAIESVQEG